MYGGSRAGKRRGERRLFSYSAPCAEETIDTLVAECDAIIHGIAD